MNSTTAANTKANSLYILPTRDRSRSKIGRFGTDKPLDRVCTLAGANPEIDLSRSVIIEVDSHRIENLVHIAFDTRREPLPRRGDGSTEWFRGDLVDEVLEFLEIVAAHRGTTYRVIRNVDTLIRERRARQPSFGKRATRLSKAEREERIRMAQVLLRAQLVERAEAIVTRLAERDFDAIVTHGQRRYLCRTVSRIVEPECWDVDGGHRLSAWGRLLLSIAGGPLRVDEVSGYWRFVDLPAFVPIDVESGHEYYRLGELANYGSLGGKADCFLDHAAWTVLEQALSHLPVVAAPIDPVLSDGAIAGIAR